MGVSTDAILYYGFDFYDSESGDADMTPEPPTEDGWMGVDYVDGPLKDGLKELGVEIDQHCHGEFPVFYLTVKEIHKRAWRGYPQDVTWTLPPIDIGRLCDVNARLRKASELLGIKYREPRLWLASYWDG